MTDVVSGETPELEFELHFDRRFLCIVAARFMARMFGIVASILTASLLAYAVHLLLAPGRLDVWDGLVLGLTVFMLLLLSMGYVQLVRRSFRILQAMGEPTTVVRLSDECLEFSSGVGSTSLRWSAIKEIWRFPESWVLVVSTGNYSSMPLRDLNERAQAYIREHAEQAGAKIR